LVIATATKVDPGFRGCITLELVNQGEVPIKLYPGVLIAQLVFHHTTSKSKYKGDYNIAIGPEFPKLGKSTPDWTFWYPQGRGKS
jgi:dCTP deaminase